MRGKTPGEVRGIILSERGFHLRTAAPYTRQKFTNLTQFNNYKLLIDRMFGNFKTEFDNPVFSTSI